MRATGAASTPGLHWPPLKPTATTPSSEGALRNLGLIVEGAVMVGGGRGLQWWLVKPMKEEEKVGWVVVARGEP